MKFQFLFTNFKDISFFFYYYFKTLETISYYISKTFTLDDITIVYEIFGKKEIRIGTTRRMHKFLTDHEGNQEF